jgi:hypothetical protein
MMLVLVEVVRNIKTVVVNSSFLMSFDYYRIKKNGKNYIKIL